MSKAKQYEKNMADQRLVVGDLVVLGNMKGANLKSIERRVDLIQKQASNYKKVADYWTALSDDGVITPIEKNILLKEWKGIEESYAAIQRQAQSQNAVNTPVFSDYTAAYNALHDYLYGTLKVFDNMDKNTGIKDKDLYSQMYSDYYYAEKFTLLSFTTGIIENFQFKVLKSLVDEGQDGDYGLYRGVIYYYADGAWHKAGNGSYLGKYVSGIPYLSIGDFFLAAANFNANVYLATEDAEIIKANNKPLAVSIAFEKGFIYEGTVKGWKKVNNRNDWKYIIAVDDLISINAEIPEHLKSFVNITAKEAVPQYLGLLTVPPVLATNMYTPAGGNDQQEYHTGDWFTWGGVTTTNWGNLTLTKGRVYKYYGDEWVQLDEQDSTNGWYLMTALPDILSTLEAGAGYFSYIFANMLLANEAFINRLGAKVIELKEGGIVKSANYEEGVQGFGLKADGTLECNNGIFRGSIESGPLKLNATSPGIYQRNFSSGTSIRDVYNSLRTCILNDILYNVTGSYGSISVENIKIYAPEIETTEYTGRGWGYRCLIDYEWGAAWRRCCIDYKRTIKNSSYRIELNNTVIEASVVDYTTEYDTTTVYLEEDRGSRPYIGNWPEFDGIGGDERDGFKDKYINYPSPRKATVQTTGFLEGALNLTIPANAMTMKFVKIPYYSEDFDEGTVYVDNDGFLKLKLNE